MDTGVDLDHPDIYYNCDKILIYNEESKQFKKAKSSTISDSNGHGTHIAGIVLEYAPTAELYVANVAPGGVPDRNKIADVSHSTDGET